MIFAGNFAFTAEEMDIYEICLEKEMLFVKILRNQNRRVNKKIITTCLIKKKKRKAARQTK
jgi:hypothetical protein